MDRDKYILFRAQHRASRSCKFYLNLPYKLSNHDLQGHLEGLVAFRKALIHDLSLSPYDPSFLLDLSSVDSKLGFTDIGAGNAHRSLVLIEAALQVNTYQQYPTNLGTLVHEAIGKRLRTSSPTIITDEIQSLYQQTYGELVNSLLGCADFWDGLIQVKAGLKRFPNDPELLEMQGELKTAFIARHKGLKEVLDNEKDIVASTRTGKIYQKKYPWMAQNLYIRTPALLRHVNSGLATSGTCQVEPVVFGPPSQSPKRIPKENEDVGPLGLFAARDIAAEEKILVDHCVTGISDVSPTKIQHCEACHAALVFPYVRPSQIILPICCKSAAFCSRACHDTAIVGYHKITCKKSFDWLFENQGLMGKEGCGTRWRPIMFLRVVACVLADFQARPKGNAKVHPLQHPLVARLAANYPSIDKIEPDVSHDWQYFENVVAPTRILMQLGINVFADADWTPEVIQTIFWRIENNANMGKTNLTGSQVVMVNLNPNYLFFNHSCEPNVSWHGAVPSGDVSIEWLKGMNGEILSPGCSAVWCTAARDIKKGEELKISYIGNPLGSEGRHEGSVRTESEDGRAAKRAWLEKWFDRGCGCRICEKENIEIDRLEAVEAVREKAMDRLAMELDL